MATDMALAQTEARLSRVVAQRDELLAACEAVLANGFREIDMQSWAAPLVAQLRAALAKVKGGVMDNLRWAIERYTYDGDFLYWYIYNIETESTICRSIEREPLETIIELLAFVQKCVREHDDHISPGLQTEAQVLFAKVKQDD